MGYGDLSSYGNPYAETPHLDRLVSEGTRYTRAVVNGVTCCPSRVSLMSGRFASRYSTRVGYIGDYGFDRQQKTLTSLLHGVGYLTMHSGYALCSLEARCTS